MVYDLKEIVDMKTTHKKLWWMIIQLKSSSVHYRSTGVGSMLWPKTAIISHPAHVMETHN